MDQTNTNIGASSTENKDATAIQAAMVSAKTTKDKAKAPAKPAPKQPAQHQQGPVVRQVATQVSSDIRNPAVGDIENPATLVTLMPRPAPVRW